MTDPALVPLPGEDREEFRERLEAANRKQRRERLKLACSVVWPATTACNAWGAPSSHGCKLDPGHGGICQCLCGRQRPINMYPERASDLTLAAPDHTNGEP